MKSQVSTYLVLSIMSHDVLIPTISIVASEFAFSTGGRVLTDMRNRLVLDAIEMIICGKNWLDAKKEKSK